MNDRWKAALVVLYLLYLSSAYSSGCPEYVDSGCNCTSDMYDCSNIGLKAMLQKTEENIRTLILSGNVISKTQVIDAPSLVYLSLANNRLGYLKYDTFNNLDELRILILSNNQLNRVTDDIFQGNPKKLQVLKLDNNALEFIQQFFFYDLEELTEIDLSNNKITFVHPHAFTHLKNLRKLSMEYNWLHTFESKWFKGLKANMFTSINLNPNPWVCDCTTPMHVSWLKTNGWLSRVLDSALQCKQPPKMTGIALKDISGSSNLQCEFPDILWISENATIFAGQSVYLDCVIDFIKLPHPVIMWIAPNNDHYTFQTADRFEGIELFQNGSIIIHNVALDDAGEYKCIATNNISSVLASTTLTIVQAKTHDGKEIPHGGTVKTQHIMANEVLRYIDLSCPDGCTCESQHVDCSVCDGQRGLTEIEYHGIPDNTVTLNLASNSIKSIPKAPANKFDSLIELRLDNNQIFNIDEGAFDNLGFLQTLTLRDNKIPLLPDNLFKNLTKLTILVLDNNELTAIDHNTFFGLSSLQLLYLRNNLIRSISPTSLAYMPKVRFIHMEHNKLTTFPLTALTAITASSERPYIQKIFVEHNEFTCDCKMNDIKAYLEDFLQWNTLFGYGIRCSFPSSLHDQYLHNVDGKLTCNNATAYKSFNSDSLYPTVIVKKNYSFGSFSEVFIGGMVVALILCVIISFVWKRYVTKKAFFSLKYTYLPCIDEAEYNYRTSGNAGSGIYFISGTKREFNQKDTS